MAYGDSIYADDEQRERARRYSRARQWLTLAGALWSAVTSVVALATGLSAWLRERAERVAPRRAGPVMPYTLAAIVLSSLASLPLSYFGGYVLEHRYGLSTQSRRAWLGDQAKRLAV